LSGLDLVAAGKPGTQPAADFNGRFNTPVVDYLGDATYADSVYDITLPTNRNAAVTDPPDIMNMGVLAAQAPAPLMAIDEDDEFFLTLSNVGMIMRPDLFEQHTVHFHGYPQASSYFDGVPDASVAIAISGSMTYYYTAPEAGTYFWHCHITPPEHLQMGMEGQLYVRPRQNTVALGTPVLPLLKAHSCVSDGIGCSTPPPAVDTGWVQQKNANGAGTPYKYAYNDGDGSTRYDVEYPIQMMGFDPQFHYVGMTFNPEDFAGMKDRYHMLSGRSYPDTIKTDAPITTESSDGLKRVSQPVSTAIILSKTTAPRALLRISDLSVTEYDTLATIGIPMTVVGHHARLLRDLDGNNLYYQTNSITLGGGESYDVILDASDPSIPTGTYFLYTTNLDHLSNDAENFGGMMTEIVVNN
jgi:FtsP/CotA-like multicopper oxidase with cupredoxin domain